MRKLGFGAALAIVLAAIGAPRAGSATTQKTFTGTVTQIAGSQAYLKSSSAAVYRAEVGGARLVRKNGSPMQFREILVGDRLEVKGTLWGDASISAEYVRNMSLYTHTSTFTGKITAIDPLGQAVTIQSRQNGEQKIRTDSFTTYKKNGKGAVFRDLELGYTVKTKGVWDRTAKDVLAKSIEATFRLVSITLTGNVIAKTDNGLTVAYGGIMYGIDITKAKLLSKNGKAISVSEISVGDTLRVQGKHISENPKIEATEIKDTTLAK